MLQNPTKIFARWACAILLLIFSSCSFVIQTSSVPSPKHSRVNLFRGVFHVHTKFSHDSKAPLNLIIKTAQKAGLDFVVVTDHNNLNAVNSYQNMDRPDRPLLIFGDEISTWGEGHLIGLGIKQEPPDIGDTQEIVNNIHKQGGYAVIAHPLSKRKPWSNWNIQNFDGLEIFCFSDTFYASDLKKLILKALLFPPRIFIPSVLENPDAGLKLWDEHLLSGRHITAFGSTDAHVKFYWHGFHAENLLLYFQAVTMYVLANEFKEETLVESLGLGRSFAAFEIYGLAQGFSFSGSAENESYGLGDSIPAKSPIRFTVKAPKTAEIRLIHNGKIVKQALDQTLEYETQEPGYYRTEVYVDGKLWIISNPIYVENPTEKEALL